MGNLVPPPSTAVPAAQDREEPGKFLDFTPVWRKWFIDLAQILNKSGGTQGSAPQSRLISTTAPLAGGNTLEQDLTITFDAQDGNQVLASPNGVNGAPEFRSLVPEDMPGETVTIVIAKITPLGNNGELVFVHGVLMAHTDPT